MDTPVTSAVEVVMDSDSVAMATEAGTQHETGGGGVGEMVLIEQDGTDAVTMYVMPSQDASNFSEVSYAIVDGTVVSLSNSQAVKDGMIILNSEIECDPDRQAANINVSREVTVSNINSTDEGKYADEQDDAEEQVTIVMFCQHCGENLNTLEELRDHLQSVHGIEEELTTGEHDSEVCVLPTCKVCSVTFMDKQELVAHAKECRPDKSGKRKEGGKSSSIGDISLQTDDSDSRLVHKCQFCDQSFVVRSLLDKHIEEGHNSDNIHYENESYYKCPYCFGVFLIKLGKKFVINHIQNEHPNESTAVKIQKVEMGKGPRLKMDEAAPLYHCPFCSKAFLWQKSMARHIKVVHADLAENLSEEDIRKLAGAKWKRRSLKTKGTGITGDLSAEVLENSVTPVHLCRLCPKKFLWQKSLKAHCLNDHKVVLDFQEDSSKIRSKGNTLFKCPFCDLVTRYASSVKKHIERKHAEKCEDGVWPSTNDLPIVEDRENISVIKLDKRPPEERFDEWSVVYKCPLCDFATNNQSNLQRHLVSKKHGNMFTDADIKRIKLSSFRVKKGDTPDSTEVERRARLGLERLRKIVSERNESAQTKDDTDSRDTLMEQASTNLESYVDDSSPACGDPVSPLHSEDDANAKENECIDLDSNKTTRNTGEIGGKFECPYCDDGPIHLEGLKLHIVRYHTDYVLSKVIKDEPIDIEINHDQTNNVASNRSNVISSYKCKFCDRSLSDLILLVNHVKNSHSGVVKTPDKINELVETTRKSSRKRKAKCFDLYETPTSKSARKSEQNQEEEQVVAAVSKTEKKRILQSKEMQSKVESGGIKLSESPASKPAKKPEEKQIVATVSEAENKLIQRRKKIQNGFEFDGMKLSESPASKSAKKPEEKQLKKQMVATVSETENKRITRSKEIKDDAKSGGMKLPETISEIKGRSRSEKSTRKLKNPVNMPNTKVNLENTRTKEITGASRASMANSCPHCDFTCKRASALNFHINFNHLKIKTESVDAEESQRSIPDSPKRKKTSIKSTTIDGIKSNTLPKSQASLKKNSTGKNEEEKDLVEMEIEEELEDDRDLDYEPEKDPDFEKFEKDFTKKVKNMPVVNAIPDQKATYRCLYCYKKFEMESNIRQHIGVMHKILSKKTFVAVEKAASEKLKTVVYLCPLCNLKSKHKASITRHVTLDHKKSHYDEMKVKCYEIIMNNKGAEQKASLRSKKDVSDATKHSKKAAGKSEKVSKSMHLVSAEEDLEEADIDNSGINSKNDSFDDELDRDSCDIGDSDDCFDENMDDTIDINDGESSDTLRFVRHFKCPYCDLKSEYKKCIIRHVGRCHSQEQDFKLQDIECVGETVLQKSKEAVGKRIAYYRCSHCSLTSHYKRCVSRHIQRWHEDMGPEDVKIIPVSVDDVKDDIRIGDAKSEDKMTSFFQCSYCGFICTTKQGVKTHASARHPDNQELQMDDIKLIDIGSSNLRNQYKCPYCSLTSLSEGSVVTHVENEHSDQTEFKPEDVLIQFVSIDEDGEFDPVVLHDYEESDEERNDFYDAEIEELDRELKEEGTKNVKYLRSFKCPFCKVTSQYKKSIIRHIGRWHDENADLNVDSIEYVEEIVNDTPQKEQEDLHYKCLYCNFVCRSKIGIRQHASVRHPKQPLMTSELICSIDLRKYKIKNVYRCPYCNLSSIWKSCIMRHIENKHEDKKDFRLDDIFSEMVVTEAGNEVEKDPRYFKCPYCQFHSKTKRGVIVHSQAAHPNQQTPSKAEVIVQAPGNQRVGNVFKCPLCQFSSSWRSAINRHMKKRHPAHEELRSEDIQCVQQEVQSEAKEDQTGIFTCPYCGIMNKWKKSIVRHIRVVHPDKSEHVSLKSATTSNMDTIPRLPPKILQCVHCDFWCKIIRVMGRHLEMNHPHVGGTKDCNNYKCVYQQTQSLASSGSDPCGGLQKGYPYKCHICNVEYNWKKSLVFHMRTRHEDVFDVFRTLDRVVDIIHTNQLGDAAANELDMSKGRQDQKILVYKCPYCELGFNFKKSLEVHLRLCHTNEVDSSQTLSDLVETVSSNAENSKQLSSNKVTCARCKVSFNSVGGLKRHRMMKHSLRHRSSFDGHACRTCGSWCRSHVALIQHRLCHHRGQGIHCGQCRRTFLSTYSLGMHQRVAHQSKQLVCKHPGCTFSCRWAITMKVHYSNRQHGRISPQSPKQQAEHPPSKPQTSSNSASKPKTSLDSKPQMSIGVRCEMCSATLTSTNQLRQHIIKQHSSRRQWLRRGKRKREFRCRVCDVVFTLQSWRDKHMQEMHPEHAEMCEFCGDMFSSEKQLSQHVRLKHREPSESEMKPYIQCEQCDQMIQRRCLRKHYLAQHPDCLVCQCQICSDPNSFSEATHTCETCMVAFCRKIYLQAHNDTCHGNWNKNKCKFCGLRFSSVLERNQHLHEEHKEAVTEASMAAMGIGAEPLTLEDTADPETQVLHIGQDQSQQYLPKLNDSSLSAVIKELQIISTDKSCPLPFKCMLCGRCFGKAKYIQLHIRRKHVRDEDQPYRCKLCGSGFVRLTDFRKHSRAHSGFRPYKCKYCNKAFKQSANLTEHMRLHSDTKDFRCEICKQTFQQRGAINAHVSRHDTLKPFKCMFCDKGFSTRGELSRHLQRYDGTTNKSKESRTYTCHICRETFSHFPVLLRHIEMHNPDKPFHCIACDTRFSSYLSMYNHKVKNGHFLNSEIECETEADAKSVRNLRTVSRDANNAVASIIKDDDTQIFLDNQLEETKPIEVVIEPFHSDEIISETVTRNENDELLSIAKQLTELSGYTQYYDVQESEHEALLQKEDEIMKDMLDADVELLANLNKQSTVTKWPKQPWSTDDNEIPATEKEEEAAPGYVVEQELTNSAAVNTITEIPTNLEDLAALIARNRSTDEALTAYQTEDGSIIYVCMPEQVTEAAGEEVTTVGEVVKAVEESTNAENEEPTIKSEVSDIQDVNQENDIEISDGTVATEPAGQDTITEEHTITVVSEAEHIEFAEGQMEISEEDGTEVSKEHTGITVISGIGPEETVLEHVQYQHIEEANAVEYIEITPREDMETVTEEQQLKGEDSVQTYPDAAEMYEEKIDGDVVEYKSDERTFIKEELVDASYSKLIMAQYEPGMDELYMTRERNFKCSKCDAVCKTKKRLREHFRRHADMKDRQHGCQVCEKRFCTRTELTRHQWTHTDTRNYQCPTCSRKFIQHGHLLDHLKVHRGVKNFNCDKCDMRFRTKSQMKCHWARMHGRRQFACDQCEKCFTTRQGLVTHQGFNHSAIFGGAKVVEKDDDIERPFQCHICGKSYTRKARLQDHMFTHNNVGRFICEICGAAFSSNSSMKYHYVSKHTDMRKETCEICCQTFKTRESLNRHIRGVHKASSSTKPPKIHQCPICLKMFKTAGSLAYHAGISKKCKEGGPGLQQKGSSSGVQVIDIQND